MFKLTIATDNAAFDDGTGGQAEIARILKEVARRLEQYPSGAGGIRDANGSVVGTWEITK